MKKFVSQENHPPQAVTVGRHTTFQERLVVRLPPSHPLRRWRYPSSISSRSKGGSNYRASDQARAFLFQGPPYRALVDLGQPNGDQIIAHGARPTDRLCVYDPGNDRVGCKDIVPGDDQVELLKKEPGWEPQVIVSPILSRTLQIELRLPMTDTNRGLDLVARVYPIDRPALDPVTLTLAGPAAQIIYTATIPTEDPLLEGYVWVGSRLNDALNSRQTVTEFAIGGNPVSIRGMRAPTDGRQVSIRGMRVSIRGMRAPRLPPTAKSSSIPTRMWTP